MDNGFKLKRYRQRAAALTIGLGLAAVCAIAQESEETEERIRIAAANMEDAVVVDCQLPGKLRRLGGTRNYLTPGRLIRTSAIVCRTRGGEYTLGDLASGTLSLQRWLEPAREGDAEAQSASAHAEGKGAEYDRDDGQVEQFNSETRSSHGHDDQEHQEPARDGSPHQGVGPFELGCADRRLARRHAHHLVQGSCRSTRIGRSVSSTSTYRST
jgi:hypothetical protein